MNLQRVRVQNFRQYRGSHTVVFAQSPAKNVTVINGNNGAGKTNLFLAMNWCLYGEGMEDKGEIINRGALQAASVGDTVIGLVEVAFTHKGEPFLARRQLERKKTETGWAARGPEFSLVQITASGDAKIIDNPIGKMNSILPSNVRTYFFFDGEKIDDFARAGNQAEVRDAVRNVLDIEILERSHRHLDAVAKDLAKELRSFSVGTEMDKLLKEEADLRERLEVLSGERAGFLTEENAAKQQMHSLEGQLGQLSESRELIERAKGLREQLIGIESQQSDAVVELRSRIPRSISLAVNGAIQTTVGLLDQKRRRGEIPSGIRETFIRDLLKKGSCICGRPLSEHDEATEFLESRLQTAVSAQFEDVIINAHAQLRSLSTRRDSFREDLRSLLRRRSELLDAEETTRAQLDDVDRQLAGIPAADIQALKAKVDEYRASLMTLHGQGRDIDGRIQEINRRLEEIGRELKKMGAKDERGREIQKQMELARSAADRVASIMAEFADQMRLRIRKTAQDIFQSLVYKGSQWQDMELDEAYELNIVDRWGHPVLPELSAGERQVLSLSFILAMAKVANREAPLVMDTPFGRLSSAHRENIAEKVPELAQQVALFVTDEELRDGTRTRITPRVGAEFDLVFDDHTGDTTIVARSS